MSAADRLLRKARHYEMLAASHDERAPLLEERRIEWQFSAIAFTLAAIVLREIASVLDGEDEP